MATILERVEDRLGAGLKKFQPILSVSTLHDVRRTGLKTTYYLRSLGASLIEKASVGLKEEVRVGVGDSAAAAAAAPVPEKKTHTAEQKLASSIEAMRNGGECEACQ